MKETQASTDWRDRAACRDQDPELFFPVGNSGPALEQEQAAKAVCAACPVATECLNYALGGGLTYGIYGGTSAPERRALRIREALAA
ncbi:WhiB family transcriptional regulator [Actinopolyspora halophila]|uniref:WhiB family transcriptional regulator n=1 Tax=Actinopolyspora halophila TaxID=1850 RepID=UPI0003659F98|nr:WhiB family transcriptional regulator [Actinopolyspora halophila]